jgi:hypothetical protein
MLEGGIASKLMEPTRSDKTCNIVKAEEEAFGLKSEHFLLYPKKLLCTLYRIMCYIIFA